jgi:hypothetical protein
MKYVVINNACDGKHISVHATLLEAQWKVQEQVGQRSESFVVGRAYYSDWGNRVVIEQRADNWTVAIEKRIDAAFDARECGCATKVQIKLLDDNGF